MAITTQFDKCHCPRRMNGELCARARPAILLTRGGAPLTRNMTMRIIQIKDLLTRPIRYGPPTCACTLTCDTRLYNVDIV